MSREKINQYVLTPAAGKRLIAKSILHIDEITEALKEKTIVIVAGTTNGYIAEEVLKHIGQLQGFSKKRFFRGITLPNGYKTTNTGRLPDESGFIGDVVIEKGKWLKGKTIYDVADGLLKGDIIIKGANAVDIINRKAAILIGDPKAGTAGLALQAAYGRRVSLYLPAGLEKRIAGDIDSIAQLLADKNASGERLMPVNGTIITELDAIKIMTGAYAFLAAAGGVCGAEGSCWIAVKGGGEELEKADALIKSVIDEPLFEI